MQNSIFFFFSDGYTFSTSSRDFAHPGKWSDPRRDALAVSIFALSCQKPPTFAKRDMTLEIASLEIF